MEQPHSIGDALIVVALVAGFIGYLYIKSLEKRRRLETIHAERVIAMEKGIPLPDLPLEPTTRLNYWLGLGLGEVAELLVMPENTVKSYLHRARRLLHVMLQARGFEHV